MKYLLDLVRTWWQSTSEHITVGRVSPRPRHVQDLVERAEIPTIVANSIILTGNAVAAAMRGTRLGPPDFSRREETTTKP